MKRFNVQILEDADLDLFKLALYIIESGGSVRTAERYVDRIIIRCRKIGNIPFGGRPRDDLLPGLRMVPFEKNTIIAYRITGDTVEITNVFHGGRDYEALFRDHHDS